MKKRYLLLVLLLGFFFIPKNTFAADSLTIEPTRIGIVEPDYSTVNYVNPINFVFSSTTFHGYKFSAYVKNRTSFNFIYENNTNIGNYDIDFLLFSSAWTQYNVPFRMAIKNGTGKIFNCDVSSSSFAFYDSSTNSIPTSSINTVSCKNVDLTSEFHVWLYDSITTAENSRLGLSNFTLKKSQTQSSIEQTEETKKQTEEIKKQTEEQKKTNDTLKDDNTDEANTKGSGFFNSFTSESHGLSGIVTAPLQMLQSLTTATCKPLKFKLPFVDNEVTLPCMRSIYEQHFGVFFTLWQTITTGLISYTVCLNFYKKIRDLQNPNNDRIEVLNL